MNHYRWHDSFEKLFDRCVKRYRSGDSDFSGYYGSDDNAFLADIGCQPREFFDFVEDFSDGGEPTLSGAVLVAAVRRDYFRNVQAGVPSQARVSEDDLPALYEELGGFPWLPRIIFKATAKLKGELHPNIMYGCGGDRHFLQSHNIHPADFLRAVWNADTGRDHDAILAFVRGHTGS